LIKNINCKLSIPQLFYLFRNLNNIIYFLLHLPQMDLSLFHTRIPYRNKSENDCPDTPRYKAIGNSMAVPVMRWIGKRIKEENM